MVLPRLGEEPARPLRAGPTRRLPIADRRARDEWLACTGEERAARSWTVERWLRYWLSTRAHLRPTSMLHYTRDVEQVLIPRLGTLRLADLDGPLLRARFAEIANTTNRKGQPQSPSAMQHLRTTLCAALNHAVREGMIETNPARHIEVHGYRRPHAKGWTDDQITDWQHTGQRPAVAVWTAEHLATFLTAVTDESLYALWWLIGLRDLRRGEACGLRWSDIDLDRGVLYIVRNRTTAGYQIIEGPPKTAAGTRTVALDEHTLQILRQHRARQIDKRARRRAASRPWQDSGYVFVRMDGLPIHPSNVSCRFRQLLNRGRRPTDPAARPAPHRRVHRPPSRRRPQDPARPARPLEHPRHRRHLHQRPTRRPAPLRQRHRQTRRHGRPPHCSRRGFERRVRVHSRLDGD